MSNLKLIIKSPGRINLIGEHIDYNGGYVLPGATDLFIKFTFSNSEKDCSVIESKVIGKKFNINLSNLIKSSVHWENYIIGSLKTIIQKKCSKLKNFNCLIEGNLPVGSGISSSSSLICGFVKGIGLLNGLNFDNNDLLLISREVEYDFIGLKGGLMDQFTIINGKKNNLILLDTKDNSSELIQTDLGNYKILLLNSNKKHDLSESSYNDRVSECEDALSIINNSGYNYKFLAEVKIKVLDLLRHKMSLSIYNRAKYVIEENFRTKKSVELIKKKNLKSFGAFMYLSHTGLKELYEVSCDELDFLVDQTKEHKAILGARMMGGGFGGCTINLIDSEFVEEFVKQISKEYFKKFSIPLTPLETTLGDGVSKLS